MRTVSDLMLGCRVMNKRAGHGNPYRAPLYDCLPPEAECS
jgi:hypothetical protein